MIRSPCGLAWILAVATGAASCAPAPSEDALRTLQREVGRLQDSLAATGRDVGSLLADAHAGRDDLVIGLGTPMLTEVLTAAADAYLGNVRLHLRHPAVVKAGDDVRVHIGPLNPTVGRWTLNLTIERIDAVLRADSVLIAVPDSQHLSVTVPVQVGSGEGEVVLDFKWDARRVVGVACGDFSVRQRFSGTVEPGIHRVHARIRIEQDSAGLWAVPTVEEKVSVSPRPTPQSWARVRAILAEQDRIFNCGLAISREHMEAMLRDLLEEGFRFSLPSSILQPLPLPAGFENRVEVAGRTLGVSVDLVPPRFDPDRLWFVARVELAGSRRPAGVQAGGASTRSRPRPRPRR